MGNTGIGRMRGEGGSKRFNGKVFPQQRRFARSRLLPSRVVRQTIYTERYTRSYTRPVVFWRTFSHDTIYLIIARFICNDESEFPVAKEIPRSACVAPCWPAVKSTGLAFWLHYTESKWECYSRASYQVCSMEGGCSNISVKWAWIISN